MMDIGTIRVSSRTCGDTDVLMSYDDIRRV